VRRPSWLDLALVAGLALLAGITSLAESTSAARTLLGIALLTFLPGYAVGEALLHGRDLGIAERLMFAVAVSLSVATVGGMLVFPLGGGSTLAWVLLLVEPTVGACIIAAIRRRRRASVHSRLGHGLHPLEVVPILVALLLCGGSLMAARAAARIDTATVTQLWMLPSPESEPGTVTSVRVGALGSATRGMTVKVTAGGRTLLEEVVDAVPGGSWERTVPVPAELAELPVRAALKDPGQGDETIRRVELWPRDTSAGP